jgi:hypothetical protein
MGLMFGYLFAMFALVMVVGLLSGMSLDAMAHDIGMFLIGCFFIGIALCAIWLLNTLWVAYRPRRK